MKVFSQEILYIIKAIFIVFLGIVLYFSLPFIPFVSCVFLSALGLLISAVRLLKSVKMFVSN